MIIDLELVPTDRPGCYEARHQSRVLLRSRQPFCKAARQLLACGFAPEATILARHQGNPMVALRSTLGEAARWSVRDSDRGGLSRVPWQPFDPSRLARGRR